MVFFARLVYYLFTLVDVGEYATLKSLHEYYGVAYGNFISGFASFGFAGIFIIGLIYILVAIFFLNNTVEKRPYTKILKRI